MYKVKIEHSGEIAELLCDSHEEAIIVRQGFINWGGFGYSIFIIKV